MGTIKRFEDLEAWKLARLIHQKIGAEIDSGVFKNNYRLINQIEGSTGSIMDNIAEGFERGTRAEFIQFLGYSKGSCGEFRSQLYRSLDRKRITQDFFDAMSLMAIRNSAMIKGLISYLQKTNIQGDRMRK